MTQPPPPLDYRPPRSDRPDRGGSWRQLLLGVGIGIGVPAVTFLLLSRRWFAVAPGQTLIAINLGVILTGFVLVLLRGYRAIGAGILLVTALGLLTVLGICAIPLGRL